MTSLQVKPLWSRGRAFASSAEGPGFDSPLRNLFQKFEIFYFCQRHKYVFSKLRKISYYSLGIVKLELYYALGIVKDTSEIRHTVESRPVKQRRQKRLIQTEKNIFNPGFDLNYSGFIGSYVFPIKPPVLEYVWVCVTFFNDSNYAKMEQF